MKRYLWIAVVVAVTMSANALENPFALDENFKKLDQEQASLIDELKSIAATQEVEEDALLDDESDEEETSVKEEDSTPVPAATPVVNEPVEVEVEEVEVEAVSSPNPPKSVPKEVVEIEKIKTSQAELDAQREAKAKAEQEALKKAQAEAAAKKEAEEKAAKEKAAKEKAAKEKAEAERIRQEKEAQAKKEAEHQAKLRDEAEQKAIAQVDALHHENTEKKQVKEAEKTGGVDINITREELEAKRRADEEMRRAIMEVDQED